MRVLGIWDGHDSGAALIDENQIRAAANEERFTRRKLDVSFPARSIAACLKTAHVEKGEIRTIAAATFDFSKTLTRVFPGLKEHHYLARRRKKMPAGLVLQKKAKFFLTAVGPSFVSRKLSELLLTRRLREMGFHDFDLFLFDHHTAHAATAAYLSPFEPSAVVTVDGVGDGLSATVSTYENETLTRQAEISARDSLGVFFEQVTFLLNMRELEDEGKVMALSTFGVPDASNPMTDFFKVEGLSIRSRYSPTALFDKLRELAFRLPWEQFAWMAQQTLELKMTEFFQNVEQTTKAHNVAWAGGVAANIKMNRKIRRTPGIKRWFVFPHMGDGGIALGAALRARAELGWKNRIPFSDVYLGPEYSEEEIHSAVKQCGLQVQRFDRIEEKAAELLAAGNVLLWFQGRMEYGPRALGNRSILAPADDLKIKDKLNLILKRRTWFQPFCPVFLREDAAQLLEDFDSGPSPFMTMAYQIKSNQAQNLQAVTAPDLSCRPQLLGDENPRLRKLLIVYQQITGKKGLLNTSFNRHGEPIVNTPKEAISVFLESRFPVLILDHFLLQQPESTEHRSVLNPEECLAR